MGTNRTRRGFFGALAGLAALPALAWRYPPVRAVSIFGKLPSYLTPGMVLQFLHNGRVVNKSLYYVVRRGYEERGVSRIDHRPTWDEVREIVKYPPVLWREVDPTPEQLKKEPPWAAGQVYALQVRGERLRGEHFVLYSFPSLMLSSRSYYSAETFDHRPTWADVRDVLRRHPRQQQPTSDHGQFVTHVFIDTNHRAVGFTEHRG